MLTTHATGSATALLIFSCSFVFRVVGFIDGLKIFTLAVHANLASAISGSVQYK